MEQSLRMDRQDAASRSLWRGVWSRLSCAASSRRHSCKYLKRLQSDRASSNTSSAAPTLRSTTRRCV
eukprot:6209533-Pleurochrysis_carterae.AAC.2